MLVNFVDMEGYNETLSTARDFTKSKRLLEPNYLKPERTSAFFNDCTYTCNTTI